MVLPQRLNHVATQYHAEKHPIGYTPCTYHEGGFPRPVVSCRVQSILVFFSSQNRVRCWQCTVNPNLRSKTSGVLMKWLCPSRHLKYKIMPDGARCSPSSSPNLVKPAPWRAFTWWKNHWLFLKEKKSQDTWGPLSGYHERKELGWVFWKM